MDIRNRAFVSVALVVVGITVAVIAGIIPSSEGGVQAQGIVLDYGDFDTEWAEADVASYETSVELLQAVCDERGYEVVITESGEISSINGMANGEKSWGFWVIYPGSSTWVELDAPYDEDPSEFTIASWSYLGDGEEPTVAVDYNGNPIYGYSQKYRVVSLSPTITEIVASLKAENILVGVDSYSNYPESVVSNTQNGKIAVVGTYTSPSFELITGTNPDIVFCDGSQRSHMQMSVQLRASSVDSVLLYPGEDLESILDNLFIVGMVMNYELASDQLIADTNDIIDRQTEKVLGPEGGPAPEVMISLEPDISPWVSGDGTYAENMVELFNGNNVFSEWAGWVHITSDRIPYANPDLIIIITTEYSATQEEYDQLYHSLSAQWQDTDAWKEGNVYVLCEGAAEMAQRFGPRTGEFAELMAMILHPSAFDTELPKYIGNDYADYLSYNDYLDM